MGQVNELNGYDKYKAKIHDFLINFQTLCSIHLDICLHWHQVLIIRNPKTNLSRAFKTE